MKVLAKRGYIYECLINSGASVFCLVVSSNDRSTDKVINVIILSSAMSTDCVEVKNEQIGILYVNTGKVSYMEREALIREIGKIKDELMNQIDRMICTNLGIIEGRAMVERDTYKEMYENLLERVLGHGRQDI